MQFVPCFVILFNAMFCICQIRMFSNNKYDAFLLLHTVGDFLSQYGWYLLIVTVLVYLLIQYLSKRRSDQKDRSPSPQPQQGQHHQYCLYT